MKVYLPFLTLLFALQLKAQTIERQVIASGGAEFVSGNVQLQQTIGEAFISAHENSSASLMEGYQQANVKFVSLNPLSPAEASIFPNPVENWLQIQADIAFDYLRIYDVQGKLVKEQKLNGQTLIELS